MRTLAALLVATLAGCATELRRPVAPPAEPLRETRTSQHPGGALRSERELLVRSDGRSWKDGFEREYGADGRLLVERCFALDVPCGTWREWYADGTPRAEVEFGPAGSRELLANRHWHANGQLAAEGRARGGVREGEWSFHAEDGALLRRGGFRDGLRDGAWLFLRPDGTKEAEGRYERGQRVGPWTLWDEQGEAHLRAAHERLPEN